MKISMTYSDEGLQTTAPRVTRARLAKVKLSLSATERR